VKSAVVVRLWQSEIEIKVQCLSECFPLARGKQFAKRCFANISIACLWWPQCNSLRTICSCRWLKTGTWHLNMAH